MTISFGRKNNKSNRLAQPGGRQIQPLHPDCQLIGSTNAKLVDLRSPEAFRAGFIPGSLNIPDVACALAARRTRLCTDQQIFLLADDPEQLQLVWEPEALGAGAEVMGWFGPDAIDEWRKVKPEIGSIEAIGSDTLAIRMAAWNTIIIHVQDEGQHRAYGHASVLRFCVDDLPLSLDGLPIETSICLTSETSGLTMFAASLLWRFGFHRLSVFAPSPFTLPMPSLAVNPPQS